MTTWASVASAPPPPLRMIEAPSPSGLQPGSSCSGPSCGGHFVEGAAHVKTEVLVFRFLYAQRLMWGFRPSNNNNTDKHANKQTNKKTCISEQISQSEAFLRSGHTHIPADTQPCPSQILGTHLLGPDDRGPPGAQVPPTRTLQQAERPQQ